jgi:hypothetical protein
MNTIKIIVTGLLLTGSLLVSAQEHAASCAGAKAAGHGLSPKDRTVYLSEHLKLTAEQAKLVENAFVEAEAKTTAQADRGNTPSAKEGDSTYERIKKVMDKDQAVALAKLQRDGWFEANATQGEGKAGCAGHGAAGANGKPACCQAKAGQSKAADVKRAD